jgi:hypothetical protein
MVTGVSVIVAIAVFVLSAELVAVSVTVWVDVIVAGAVYNPPLVTVPKFGDKTYITPVLLDPVTVALNCCVWFTLNDADVGASVIVTGMSVMVAVAVLVLSAELVAVSVMVCVEAIVAGAVYNPPLVTVPTFGDNVYVTAVLLDPVTVAVNGCAWLTLNEADVGASVTDTWDCELL